MKNTDIDPAEFDNIYPPEQRFAEWMSALESEHKINVCTVHDLSQLDEKIAKLYHLNKSTVS